MSHKKIHVVYIITKLELGGAQKVCLNLYESLQNHPSLHASLISGTKGPLVSQAVEHSNTILLKDITREVRGATLLKELRCFITLIGTLRRLKKKYPHIVVHTHSTKAGILGRWAAWFAGISLRIHTIHGYGFHDYQPRVAWWAVYVCEWITNFITTHFICVSLQDAKTGIRLLPGFEHKHSVIRAAVSWDQFVTPARIHKPFKPHEPFVVGTVACFKPQKNLFDLLRAFQSAYHREPRLRLEIIGDGTLRYDIEHWILNNNLNNVITLHGWQQDVAPIMRTWNSFVLTSLWEGLPCAVVEARLLRLPVISYTTGGIPEVIEHDKNGLLYPQKDWHGVSNGMVMLVQEQQLYTKLQVYPDRLQDFNEQQMINEHIALYKKLMHAS